MNEKTISLENDKGFRVLFKWATISIIVISESGNIELTNPCAVALFGYEPSEILGKPFEILIPGHLRLAYAHNREDYFQTPKARATGHGMELYAKKKNGEVFPVALRLDHYELDSERLAIAFITDITPQVTAKKLLSERESWFRNMADNAPTMIWVSGIDKNCTYFNKTWLEFTGRSLEMELGTRWVEGVHPDDIEQCLFTYTNAFDNRESFVMEYRLRRNDGLYRWIQDAGKPNFSGDDFIGYIGSCTDIHDQRMAKEELRQQVQIQTNELSEALKREKELNELKSRFVSMASHEFRNPLSIVLSSTGLIEQFSETLKDVKIQKHISRIKTSIYTLTGILNDFLSLDKLEQGGGDVENDMVNVTEFLNTVAAEMQFMRKEGQSIELSHVGDQHVVLDQKKLRYIVVNLLSNAIKYSPDYETVTVSSETVKQQIVITVQDHGIGIPEEDHKYMFTKFFRAKNTGNIQGIGLGLTIVKRYVDLMGGSLFFSSKAGEGTTFKVTLPRHYEK